MAKTDNWLKHRRTCCSATNVEPLEFRRFRNWRNPTDAGPVGIHRRESRGMVCDINHTRTGCPLIYTMFSVGYIRRESTARIRIDMVQTRSVWHSTRSPGHTWVSANADTCRAVTSAGTGAAGERPGAEGKKGDRVSELRDVDSRRGGQFVRESPLWWKCGRAVVSQREVGASIRQYWVMIC